MDAWFACFTDWLIGWLTGWLADWLSDWLINWVIERYVERGRTFCSTFIPRSSICCMSQACEPQKGSKIEHDAAKKWQLPWIIWYQLPHLSKTNGSETAMTRPLASAAASAAKEIIPFPDLKQVSFPCAAIAVPQLIQERVPVRASCLTALYFCVTTASKASACGAQHKPDNVECSYCKTCSSQRNLNQQANKRPGSQALPGFRPVSSSATLPTRSPWQLLDLLIRVVVFISL